MVYAINSAMPTENEEKEQKKSIFVISKFPPHPIQPVISFQSVGISIFHSGLLTLDFVVAMKLHALHQKLENAVLWVKKIANVKQILINIGWHSVND